MKLDSVGRIQIQTYDNCMVRWCGEKGPGVEERFHQLLCEADWIEFAVVLMMIVNKAHFLIRIQDGVAWVEHVRTCLYHSRVDDAVLKKSIMTMSNRIMKWSALGLNDHVRDWSLSFWREFRNYDWGCLEVEWMMKQYEVVRIRKWQTE